MEQSLTQNSEVANTLKKQNFNLIILYNFISIFKID